MRFRLREEVFCRSIRSLTEVFTAAANDSPVIFANSVTKRCVSSSLMFKLGMIYLSTIYLYHSTIKGPLRSKWVDYL